jgi:hypothetical protein
LKLKVTVESKKLILLLTSFSVKTHEPKQKIIAK